jgi:hypothetical protein
MRGEPAAGQATAASRGRFALHFSIAAFAVMERNPIDELETFRLKRTRFRECDKQATVCTKEGHFDHESFNRKVRCQAAIGDTTAGRGD